MTIPRSKSLVLVGPRLPRHDPAPIRERIDLISVFALLGMGCDIYDIEMPPRLREVCDLANRANMMRIMTDTTRSMAFRTQP